MCLAVLAPPNTALSRERLSNGWDSNPDGGGYAFIDEVTGQIVVRKHLTWQGFITGYAQDQRDNPRSPFIVHERFGTHGTKNLYNVHPFRVDDHTVVIHNGIINCVMTDKIRSDTRTFVEDYLAKLPETWFDDEAMVDLVSDFIGSGSKLVILTTHPDAESNTYIINQKAGHWDKGSWWSNSTYKTSFKRSTTTSITPRVGGWDYDSLDDYWQRREYGVSRPGSGVQTVAAGGMVVEDDDDVFGDDIDARMEITHCYVCEEELIEHCCFDCEWCALCDKDLWKCGCGDQKDVFNAYIEYLESEEDWEKFKAKHAEEVEEVVIG